MGNRGCAPAKLRSMHIPPASPRLQEQPVALRLCLNCQFVRTLSRAQACTFSSVGMPTGLLALAVRSAAIRSASSAIFTPEVEPISMLLISTLPLSSLARTPGCCWYSLPEIGDEAPQSFPEQRRQLPCWRRLPPPAAVSQIESRQLSRLVMLDFLPLISHPHNKQ